MTPPVGIQNKAQEVLKLLKVETKQLSSLGMGFQISRGYATIG